MERRSSAGRGLAAALALAAGLLATEAFANPVGGSCRSDGDCDSGLACRAAAAGEGNSAVVTRRSGQCYAVSQDMTSQQPASQETAADETADEEDAGIADALSQVEDMLNRQTGGAN